MSPSTSYQPEPGYFQSLEYLSDDTIAIHDQLYGKHTITEPILLDLLRSPALIRLSGINQHGITGLLGLTPKVTRLEHSIGAFLLVRKVQGSLEEQVVALLHDISHTALSHVIDWALSQPGEGSFHEVHKMRFVETTQLPAILAQHGLDKRVFNEDAYPLVEMPAPHLCADRLDYALRDAVAFGKLKQQDAGLIFASLKAYPGPESPHRLLVLQDEQLGLTLARAYLAADRDVWSHPANVDMYRRTGQVIGEAVRSGALPEEQLWGQSDRLFWETLRRATSDEGRKAMRRLEEDGLPQEENLGLPRGTKIRTIDPDVCLTSAASGVVCQSLSSWCPAWGAERQEYLLARQRQIQS